MIPASGLHDEPGATGMSCIAFKNLLHLSENDENTERHWLQETRNKIVLPELNMPHMLVRRPLNRI